MLLENEYTGIRNTQLLVQDLKKRAQTNFSIQDCTCGFELFILRHYGCPKPNFKDIYIYNACFLQACFLQA